MSRPRRTEEIRNDLMQELQYDTKELQQRLTQFFSRLNPELKTIFDNLLQHTKSFEDGAPALPSDVSGDVVHIWMLPSALSICGYVCACFYLLARTCSRRLFHHVPHLSLQRIQLLGFLELACIRVNM
ncbi:hypothetical protein AVEN_144351-1 [Araneus ventricosus]|uniref:Uncharacterized protein n=1 Tax=Araneus ventricosus TaxID=182803 RepID=A0A4Y2VWE0_ARAVE|nr:hypothetical protein AVEN_144351-1 [Araneus ventricosus]